MFAGINIKAQESIIMKIIKNISDLSLTHDKGDSVIESSSLQIIPTVSSGKNRFGKARHKMMLKELQNSWRSAVNAH